MIKVKTEIKNAFMIGIPCFLAYSGCYMGRNILSTMLPQMIAGGVYSRESLAAMGSAFFITYGAGQLINGLLGNKVSAKYMVAAGLSVSGVLCILFPLFSSYPLSLILWGVCGFLCSMLWGPLSKLVGENTSERIGRILLTLLTVASIAGTAVTYFLAIFSALKENWKLGFFITGAILIAISVLWFAANIIMENRNIVKKTVSAAETEKKSNAVAYLLRNGFITVTVVTMLNGVIRNAVAFWIPTFISERFSVSVASAAAISSVLPFVNLAGTLISVWLAKRLHNDEKKMLTILFAFTTLMFAWMYFLHGRGMILNLAALFSASAAMTAACNMIFSFYVLRFTETGKISGITGFLDFSSYVSASAASILFSSLVPTYGWDFIVGIWAATTLIGVVFSWISMKSVPAIK
jgi:Sugar phosphate permease